MTIAKAKTRIKNGFTLLEMIAVIFIIATLAAIGAPVYMEYVKQARAADAQTAMGSILTAGKVYIQRTGACPQDLSELEIRDLKLDDATKFKWNFEFQCSGDRFIYIQAASTKEMGGGVGNVVKYDVLKGKFEGYGIPE